MALGGRRFININNNQMEDGVDVTLATRGLEEPFSSCAVVSVFCSGGKMVLVLHTPYVLRVPYICGVVIIFFVLAGNSFWYVRTQCTIQLCGCVIFFVVAGKLI